MKAKKGSQSSADAMIDSSTPKFNVVEVEFHYQNLTRTKRKINIPHGQFSPPLALHDRDRNQWFMFCKGLGVYAEVDGDILSNIEVA
jgi:hypothetical protein